MLSNEEKKAIEILKDNIKSLEGHTPFKHTNYKKVQAIETILNLIEKQQKEIEELKANKGYHFGFFNSSNSLDCFSIRFKIYLNSFMLNSNCSISSL